MNKILQLLKEQRDNAELNPKKRYFQKLMHEWEDFIKWRKDKPVEHCSELDCPACNLVAYKKGYKEGFNYWKERMKEGGDKL